MKNRPICQNKKKTGLYVKMKRFHNMLDFYRYRILTVTWVVSVSLSVNKSTCILCIKCGFAITPVIQTLEGKMIRSTKINK